MIQRIQAPIKKVHRHGLNSYDIDSAEMFVPDTNGVSQVYIGNPSGPSKTSLPQISMDLMTKRNEEFLKTSDDAISERFYAFEKPHWKNVGSPNLAKGAQRVCEFDKISKPKYNCHHYVHDFEDSVKRNQSTIVPFYKQVDTSGKSPTEALNRMDFKMIREYQAK